MFYVEGGGRRIMVDTGCSDPDWATRYHKPFVRTPEQEPLRALQSAGVDPATIDTVVVTHLHWDHCYNQELFTNAKFWCRHRAQYAAGTHPIFANVYEAPTTA
jgi:glyoxylase-like metal-dependent hydrolase (beta-lactamase superfamily II)